MSKSYTDSKSFQMLNSQQTYQYLNNNPDLQDTQDNTWNSLRIRQENANLRKQNSVLIDENNFKFELLSQNYSDAQHQLYSLQKENYQQQKIIEDLEKKYTEALILSENHEQEVYRMRIQYDEAKTHLEQLLKEKDETILVLKKKLNNNLPENEIHIDLRQKLEEEYARSVRQSLMDYEKQNKKDSKDKKGQHQIDDELNVYYEQFQNQKQQEDQAKIQEEQKLKELQQKQKDQIFQRQEQYEFDKKQIMEKQETQQQEIINLNTENQELQNIIMLRNNEIAQLQELLKEKNTQFETKLQEQIETEKRKNKIQQKVSQIPQALEAQELKNQNAKQDQDIRKISVQNREDQKLIRDLQAEVISLQSKVREYEQKKVIKQEGKKELIKEQEQQQVIVKVSEDRNLLNANIGLLHYSRECIVDLIFEIFVNSQNQAYNRKSNSFTIFQINIKELKEKNLRGLIIILFLYKKLKQIAKMYFPNYGKVSVLDDKQIHKKLQQFKKFEKNEDIRSNINQWLENSIMTIKYKRKHQEQKDQNRDLSYLFRLLSLMYRCKYPVNGQPYHIDMDLKIRMENKICSSLLLNFIEE